MESSIYKTTAIKDSYKFDKVLGEYNNPQICHLTLFFPEVALLSSEKASKSLQTKNSLSKSSTSKLPLILLLNSCIGLPWKVTIKWPYRQKLRF